MTKTAKLLTTLKVPVPPQLEETISYQGDAQFVAFTLSPMEWAAHLSKGTDTPLYKLGVQITRR